MEDKEVKIDEVSIADATAPTDVDANNGGDAMITADENTDQAAQADADKSVCTAQVEALIAETRELNDKYLRAVAELENTRRRAALDAESRARARAMSVAEKILPVMDAIESALKHSPDDEGIKSMARAMESAFAQIGITKIESVGQILNPQFHNAIQVVPIPADADPKPAPNTITAEMQSGYMFGDTVLRTAMVVVYK